MTSLRSLRDVKSLQIVSQGDVLPIVADGTTSNQDNLFSIQEILPLKAAPTFTKIVVTLQMGTPGVVNYPGHGLRVGDIVVFYGTGLPTGLVQGKQYWVCYENMTIDTFQITDTNMWLHFWNYNIPLNFINFTGTQSGTVYIAVQGVGWQIFTFPAGTIYTSSANQSLLMGSGQRRAKYYGYGVESVSIGPSGGGIGQTGYNWNDVCNVDPIYRANRGDNRVRIKNLARLVKYVPGSWIAVLALNSQDQYGVLGSWPSNASYCEYKRIKSIDFVNGYIYFQDKDSTAPQYLRNSYMDWFPVMGTMGGSGVGVNFPYGAACITPMMGAWDSEKEIYGFRSTDLTGSGEMILSGRKVKLVDYVFESQTGKPTPSGTQTCELENCTGTTVQMDKLIEDFTMYRCEFESYSCESGATDQFLIDRCTIQQANGTARNTCIRDSFLGQLLISPLGFGSSDSILLKNCRIGKIGEQFRLDQNITVPSSYGNLLTNWPFSNGIFSFPMDPTVGVPNAWMNPGKFAQFVYALDPTALAAGGTFRILNIYPSGTTETVTFNVSTSTVIDASPPPIGAMVSFRAVTGLLPGTPPLGTGFQYTPVPAPTGVLAYVPYYVISYGGGGYQISTTRGGSALAFNTFIATGTYQAITNLMFNVETDMGLTCPVGDQINSTVSINTSTSIFTWNNDGIGTVPPNNTPIIFKTTGTLPTDSTNGPPFNPIKTVAGYYYTVQQSGNTFKISNSPGGTAISITGTQSGVHTVVGNPLMLKPVACPRITVENCYGCPQIVDMSDGPPNMPLNSYTNRMYDGFMTPNPVNVPDRPIMIGKIKSMIVNVIHAEAGSPLTVTISCRTFNDDLTKASDMVQVINLNQVGKRTITQLSGTTIGLAGDTVTSCSRWLSGMLGIAYSNWSSSLMNQTSKWQLIIQTDQGFYDVPVCHFASENGYGDGGMTLVESDLSSTIGMGKVVLQ